MPTREELIANGFNPVTYPGQEGEFLSKTLKASDMPSFYDDVVDFDTVFDTDTVIVEVTPMNTVQLVVLDSDYAEEGVPVDSEEGMALLRDAGFPA